MDNEEAKKSSMQFSAGHIPPKDPQWLAENVEEVNQRFNQILKLIKQDEEPSASVYQDRMPKLIAHIEDILHKHEFLANQYDQLQKISLGKNSSTFQIQKDSCFESPDPKSAIQKDQCEGSSPDSSQRSNEVSPGGSESSSLLSSDSDSEPYFSANKSSMTPLSAGKTWESNFPNLELEIDIVEMKGRIAKYEEELKVSNQKLLFSEEQVIKLKKGTEEIAANYNSQLKSAKYEIQEREADLEKERKKVLELQMQVSSLETQVLDSIGTIGLLEMELEASNKKTESSVEEGSKIDTGLPAGISNFTCQSKNQLESMQQEVVLLETKLDTERRQASELRDIIQRYQFDISDRDDEIKKLSAALQDATKKFSVDEAQLKSQISTLSEHLMFLEASGEEWELRSKSLEKEIQQSKAENTEMRKLHEAQEFRWNKDFDHLKAEINEKMRLVDLLNRDLDGLKLKYDELMADKDDAVAKIQTLGAELNSRENEIREMQGSLQLLHLENEQLISDSQRTRDRYLSLKIRAEELEKEVESQKAVILDRAEEKREAIRQLCFSLEHYRSGYEELRQTYSGHKRDILMAS